MTGTMTGGSLRREAARSQFPEELVKAANDLLDAEQSIRAASSRIWELEVEYHNTRFRDPEGFKEVERETAEIRAAQGGLYDEAVGRRKPFLNAAIAHARDYCQELSAAITQALPREVRDMIYKYLCQKVPRLSVKPVNALDRVPQEIAHQAPYYIRRLETPLPYLFSPKYLSKTFLSELAPILYANATFHLWDANDIELFLHQDFLHVDCAPKDHVRALSLAVHADSYGWPCSSKRAITKKLSNLTHLFELKHKEKFRLDLHLCISHSHQRPVVPRFHQILLPYLYELKAAGFNLRFPLKKHHYGKNFKSDRSEMNQLQAGTSKDPRDWVVDEEELRAWEESDVIKMAFMKSARFREKRYYDDEYDEDTDSDVDFGSEEEELPPGFVDGEVGSEEEDDWM